ncbi:class I SAM-dependent methyltransferase [Demetria terragena]|uniref:class I SAM-dependent methyltransferase n=1 Tax=Demetria terragena TaxID=63959 RepID=UPI00037DE81F|nr:class I SAM-dependent methyltransferase [Demetria terragena]
MAADLTGSGMTQEVYEARRTSFEEGAAEYERVRPEWPAETLAWLLGDPGAPRDVLDIGAGTGKATRVLADLGHHVTALEPAAGMREVLQASVAHRAVQVLPTGAESIPLPDSSIDAAVCLQAWHWVDHDIAGPEVARVLRPGGTFGLAWHSLDVQVPWVRELHEVTCRPEASETASDEEPLDIPGFAPAHPVRRAYIMRISPEDLAVQVRSWSHITIHPDKEEILGDVRTLGQRVAGDDGLLELPHVTTCFRTQVQ